MASYDGYGSWNTMGNAQGFGNTDGYQWNRPANSAIPHFSQSYGMMPCDSSPTGNGQAYRQGSEGSYGFGLSSGYSRGPPFPSSSRNRDWDNSSRQSSMAVGSGARTQDNSGSQNRYAEMGYSGALTNSTGTFRKRIRKRKRRGFTVSPDLPDPKLPKEAGTDEPATNFQSVDGAKEPGNGGETSYTFTGPYKKRVRSKKRKNPTVNADVSNAWPHTEEEKTEPVTNEQSKEGDNEPEISGAPTDASTGQLKKRVRKRKRKSFPASSDLPHTTQPKEAEKGGPNSYNFGQKYTEKSQQMSHPAHTNKVAPQAGHFRGAPSGPYLQAGNGNSEQCIPYGTMRDWPYLFSQQWGMMSNPTDFFNAMFQWFSAGAKGSGCPPPSSSPGQCPDVPVQPGLKAFTAGSFFGGGFTIRQKRNRKRKQSAPTTSPKEGEAAAEKQANCTDDPETKYEGSETDGDEDAEMVEKGTKTDVEVKESDEKAVVVETGNEDKVVPEKSQQDPQDKCSREQIMQIQFVCTLCNFRTFYDEDITHHVQSDFHKEHLLHMRSQFPNQTADFLEEHLLEMRKKTEEHRLAITDLERTVRKIYRYRDVTKDLGMEHFVKKVEAAHCAACDVLIPMRSGVLQKHLKTPLHIQNCKNMMEQSKQYALSVARRTLNNRTVAKKLDSFVRGEDHNNVGAGNTMGTVPGCPVEDGTLKPFTTEEETECSLEEGKPLETALITAEEVHLLEAPKSTAEEDGMKDSPVITLGQGDVLLEGSNASEDRKRSESPLTEGSTDVKSSLEKEDMLDAYVSRSSEEI